LRLIAESRKKSISRFRQGADDSQGGEIARNTKRLIQQRFRAKSRR
jgi:hypothetical protein